MKITETYGWHRRDFSFTAKCEHCGNVETNINGYDDDNFYNNVVPDMKCTKCSESTNSKPNDNVPKTIIIPKYDPNLTF
jgi:hypothetical protein